MKPLLSFLLLALIALPAQAQEPERYTQLRAITESNAIGPGETITIGLEERIYPEWHVYWKNPGDSGEATSIEWMLPPGFEVSEIKWPYPHKLPFGPLTNYGHEERLVLLQQLTAPDNYDGSPITLRGTVDLLVCKDICIPESGSVSLTLNNGDADHKGLIDLAREQTPLPVGWPASFARQGDELVVEIMPDDMSILEGAHDFMLFPEEWGIVNNSAATAAAMTDNKLVLAQAIGERPLSEVPTSTAVLVYTDGHGGPDGEGKTRAIRFSMLGSDAPLTTTPPSTSSLSYITAIFFALLGGLILNLMPCVFPVLSMKALSLANMKDKDDKKIKNYVIAYTAGILISFALLAGLLLSLKAGGETIGWGFQLQNPVMIAVLSYVVFTIGLNLAGYFEFGSSFAGFGQHWAQKDGTTGAFFTGVLAAIVATPCTAPFMAGAMGYALTQHWLIGMSVFLALGFGLALPYVALGFIPAFRHILPRPGAWMATFRQLLCFPMFATAAWLIWVLSQQTGAGQVFLVLEGLVAITFIVWLQHKMPAHGVMRYLSWALMVLLAGFLIFTLIMPRNDAVHQSSAQPELMQNWENFTPAKLEEALSGPYPVFVNMTAAWCITCKVNEQVALNTEETRAAFADNNVVYLKGDWTNRDDTITNYLQSYGRSGVPIYVYYGPPDTSSGQRPDPVVLPQILTPGTVLDLF